MVLPLISGQVLPTTVVGSFPAHPRRSLFSPFDPFREAVRQAVESQIQAGITIISDGQVRGDMIGTFASHLPGIRGKDVIGRVMPPNHPITIRDTRYARSRHPFVKGILTGPSTLAYGLHLHTSYYRSRDELIPDMAAALSNEAHALNEAGITMLQIDEPILSTGTADLSVAREAIGHIVASVQVPVCLHVCGSITPIIDEFVRMPVKVLDFEGSIDPENFASLSSRDLRDRYIGYGCVDSSRPVIEGIDTIVSRIRAAIDILGHDPLLPDPDCGLRMLPPDVAFAKLSHLGQATALVRGEISS